jgi:hypothetical protein
MVKMERTYIQITFVVSNLQFVGATHLDVK